MNRLFLARITFLLIGVGGTAQCSAWPALIGVAGAAAGGGGGGGGGGAGLIALLGGPSGTRTLTSVEVGLGSTSIARGTSTTLLATGIYSDGSRSDISGVATFSSDDTNIATITGTQVRGANVGFATVRGTHAGVTGTVTITVTNATLVSIGITPANPSIAKGTTQQFTATGTFTDSTTQDLTAAVGIAWSSDDAATASVGAGTGLATGNNAGATTIRVTLGTVQASQSITVTSATLVSLSITPASPSIANGLTQQFTATGTYTDSTTQDVTASATWTSSDTGKATISNAAGIRGLATSVAPGTTTITASLGAATPGTTVLTVTAATLSSIAVTPPNPSKAKGLTQQFTATGTYTDSSTLDITASVTWSSDNTAAATVSNTAGTQGLGTAVDVGTANISATLSGKTGTTAFTVTSATLVSIAVTPSNPSKAKGLTQQFTATGTYTDSTTQDITASVAWSSSDTAVASISNAAGSRGLASALNAGTATITATSGATSGNTLFTVTAAVLSSISVTPTNPSIANGLTQQFTATGTYSDSTTQDITSTVTWSSSDTSKATISNAAGSQGLAASLAAGSTTITATSGAVSGNTTLTVTAATLVSISVTPATPSVAKGLTQQFTATGTYTDSTTQNLTASVTWSSSDTSKATISNASGTEGLATTLVAGSTTITATSGAVSGNTTLTVTAATLVSISVTPATPSVAKGLAQQFTATGTYTDSTTQDLTTVVTWTSSDTAKATISNAGGSQGLASTLVAGTTTITATHSATGINGSTTLTVTAATLVSLSVTPTTPSMPTSRTLQFSATGTYTDSTTQDLTTSVTWSSSDTTKAQISNAAGSRGIASSIAAGTTTITATSGAVSGNTVLTVSAATLQGITVTPVNPSLAAGFTRQFTATGTYSDSSTVDLTTSVTWSSSDTGKATISNAGGSNGLASGVALGTTTITATLGAVSGNTSLVVTAATLSAITVSPSTATIANGTTRQFTVIGTFSDSTTQDLTTAVTWSSSSTGVATISNAAGTQGKATSAGTGTTTITATHAASGKTSTASLTVTAATLTSISVSPSGAVAIGYGTYQQFTAVGTYSDSSTQDITAIVTWSSSSTGVATISNASPTQGRATSVASGFSTITATLGAVSNNATLEVRIVTLVSIAVTPSNASFGVGQTQQMVATGTYNDASTQDLSTQVVWSSGTPANAVVSNAPGSQGLVTGVANGTSLVSATRDGVTGSATVTVTADVTAPTISSAILTSATTIKVTYSEAVNVSGASTASNYKVAVASALTGSCSTSDNDYFSNASQTSDFTISSVTVLSPTEFQINISAGMSNKTYAVVAHRTNIQDLAGTPNNLGCPNSGSFAGIDTVKPYMVSIVNGSSTTITVTFSEAMKRDGSSTAANNINNYTLAKVNSGDSCANNPTVSSVSIVSSDTFQLSLSAAVCGIDYKLTTSSVVTDEAVPTPNTMGSPSFLTFTGNEQLKVVSAVALSTTTVELVFNKAVDSGSNTAGSAGCTGDTECSKRYKFSPSLGQITSAVVGTGTSSNVVTLTHQNAQLGKAYTIIAANNVDGDQFDNTTWGSIKNAAGTENVQAAPKDRASFVGLGSTIQNFSDGSIFVDPFVDGSVFSFAFSYAGRVYLGTNDKNNATFRFDPNGANSITATFKFTGVTSPSCSTTDGFGYITSNITTTPTCGTNSGPIAEVGVVGFDAVSATVGGASREVLVAGPLKNGVSNVYYTQDVDNQLDWLSATVTGTNGTNSKSVQTIAASGSDEYVFIGISSDHNSIRPILNRYKLTESGGVVSFGSPTDMDIKDSSVVGNGAVSNGRVQGIESILKFGTRLFLANQGGVAYSASYNTSSPGNNTSTVDAVWSSADLASATGYANSTLVMPDSNSTNGGGLGKVRPGQKGIPTMFLFNGKLYLARNVGNGTNNQTNVRGELWKCASPCTASTDWTRIISGSETALGGATAISMIKSNGSSVLYVGFDDATNGAKVYKTSCTDPAASSGSSGTTITTGACGGTGSANWTLQGSAGFGDTNNKYVMSATSISDGTNNYIYVVVGDGGSAVKVFRQID